MAVAAGVFGAMLVTVLICAGLLWVEGCAVAVWAVLRTHSWLAILAVDLALFLLNALLLLFLASYRLSFAKKEPQR